ncbi:MAG: sulfotransferase [Pirellulales bacterium]|nr:sulfotransferase [Pirellulales bacterium]
MASRKPNLFIVGAMKSGTSSLHNYLGDHPEVFMCEPKEPCYFVAKEELNWPAIEAWGFWKGEQNYLKLFENAGHATIIGESSTLYTKAPHINGVPGRIAQFNPEARLIYVMRDPVERTISHYWHHVNHNDEWREPLAAIRDSSLYRDVSNYAMQLDPYVRLFGIDRIFVLTFEELTAAPARTLAKVFHWLGVDDQFTPRNLNERANVTPEQIDQVRFRGWLKRLRFSPFWNRVGPWVPKQLRMAARSYSTRKVDRKVEQMNEVRSYLRPLQADQTSELSRLLKRKFPEWESLLSEPSSAAICSSRETVECNS